MAGDVVMKRKYQIDTEENREFLKVLRNELLSFGHRFPSPGGGAYYLGDDGTPWKDRPRETWITSRMIHVYSIGSFLGHESAEELTDAALKGLRGELHDAQNGGWYAGLTADGAFLPNKQCYAHAFVILAASSALLAGRPGAKELLEEALQIYDERFWNEEEGLSCDTWNTEFTVLDSYRGLNANMHTVEAFLAVADVLQADKYRERAGRIIEHVIDWAADNNWRIPEHFHSDWTPDLECNREKPEDQFKPYGATPGHGLEWARLITQWALSAHLEPTVLDRYIAAAEKLYDRAVKDGWNCDGAPGIVYTTDWEGNPIVHDRMHWTLAEAINTAAVLFRVTGKEGYAEDYQTYMQYLDEKVLDHVNGSWFHQLDRENRLIGTVWPGKSDIYHALQATLIPYSAVDVSIAAAVKKACCTMDRANQKRYDVVALGELLIDFTENGVSAQGNPILEANPGGAPCNVLSMLSKLGRKVSFIGKVGNDMFGTQLETAIAEAGIDTAGLLKDEKVHTTLAFVHTLEGGERDFSFYRNPGADMMLRAEELPEELLKECRIFHFGTLSMTADGCREATQKAIALAREAGAVISFDPNLREPLWDSLEKAKEQTAYGISQCDILKISDNEIQWFTGKEDYEEGVRFLQEKYGCRLILVSLGKDGSMAYSGEQKAVVPAFLQDNTIEATGAGDSFCGCILHQVLEKGLRDYTEDELKEMLLFANATASIVTTRKGALRVMATPDEIHELLERSTFSCK